MPVCAERVAAYGQVAGEVTETGKMVAPSVTSTVAGTGAVPKFTRVIVSVLPVTAARMFGLVELVLNVPDPPMTLTIRTGRTRA